MASKMIMDSPNLLEETLIPMAESCKHFPGKKRSRPAAERYVRKGIRGVVLESILVCGRRYTSLEAIDRFIRGQLQVEAEKARPEPSKSSLSKKEIADKSEKYGLHVPE